MVSTTDKPEVFGSQVLSSVLHVQPGSVLQEHGCLSSQHEFGVPPQVGSWSQNLKCKTMAKDLHAVWVKTGTPGNTTCAHIFRWALIHPLVQQWYQV